MWYDVMNVVPFVMEGGGGGGAFMEQSSQIPPPPPHTPEMNGSEEMKLRSSLTHNTKDMVQKTTSNK